MADQNTADAAALKKATEEATAKATAEATAAALAKFQRFNTLCPDDPAFVAAQFAKGSSVEEFALALAEKRAGEITKLKAGPVGNPALPFNGADAPPAPPAPKDFMTLAKEHADAHKTSLSAAMSVIAQTTPAAYEAFVKSAPTRARR